MTVPEKLSQIPVGPNLSAATRGPIAFTVTATIASDAVHMKGTLVGVEKKPKTQPCKPRVGRTTRAILPREFARWNFRRVFSFREKTRRASGPPALSIATGTPSLAA
jgi:hypothetical protein